MGNVGEESGEWAQIYIMIPGVSARQNCVKLSELGALEIQSVDEQHIKGIPRYCTVIQNSKYINL